MIKRLLAWLHYRLFIKPCKHEDATYDLLEGERGFDRPVTWCRRCGAVKIVYHPSVEHLHTWRTPRPDWSAER